MGFQFKPPFLTLTAPPPEEVGVSKELESDPGGDAGDAAGGALPASVSTEMEEDVRDYYLDHQRVMAELILSPEEEKEVVSDMSRRDVESFLDISEVTKEATFSPEVLALFQNQVGPFPRSVVQSSGFLSEERLSILETSGLISADRESNISSAALLSKENRRSLISSGGRLRTSLLKVVSFRWSMDLSTPSWGGLDQPLASPVSGIPYLLAIRVLLTGKQSTDSSNPILEVATLSAFGTPSDSDWNPLSVTAPWDYQDPINYTAKGHGGTVSKGEFVCNTGGGTLVDGVFNSGGGAPVGVVLSPGEETEMWFSVIINFGTTGYSYFRLSSTLTGQYPDEVFDPIGRSWSDLIGVGV